jgi:hypothetical protein
MKIIFKFKKKFQIPFHLWELMFQPATCCPTFQFISISCIWKSWKCTLSSNQLVKIHKTNHVNSEIGENKRAGALSTMSSIYSMSSPFLQNLSNKDKKYNEKKKTKKWTTLNLSLHFGSSNYEFFFKLFFWSQPIDFPFKILL